MRLRFLATSLLVAGGTGCVAAPPPPAGPDPSMNVSPAVSSPPQPDALVSPPVYPPLITLSAAQGYTAPVGESIEVTAVAQESVPVWRILPEDQDKADLTTTVGDFGKTANARLVFRRPGLVRLRATVRGHSAEMEVAGIEAPAVSKPTIEVVTKAFSGPAIVLITSAEAWQAFDAGMRMPVPPPVDFSQRSVVAVHTLASEGQGGPAVVTHTTGRDIHLASPGEKELMALTLGSPRMVTVIQSIPRVPPDARFIVSGSLYQITHASSQDVVRRAVPPPDGAWPSTAP